MVIYFGYCIEMAYRKGHHRMSKKAGLRKSKRAGLKKGKRATRKAGLKRSRRAGMTRRVKGGSLNNGDYLADYDYPTPKGWNEPNYFN